MTENKPSAPAIVVGMTADRRPSCPARPPRGGAETRRALPAGFDLAAWRRHAHAILDEWLNDFAWAGRCLARHIRNVQAVFDSGPPLSLWRSPPSAPAAAVDRTWCQRDFPELRDPVWDDLADAWALTGPWLHPDTVQTLHPDALACNDGHLLIGCLDRDAPHLPRRFDATRPPDRDDLGVIGFPLLPWRALEFLDLGCEPGEAMLLTAGTTLISGAVHESLETFLPGGERIWDPHGPEHGLHLNIRWTEPNSIATQAPATYDR